MVTRPPKDLRRLALAGCIALGLACDHTDPFSTPPYGATSPLDPTPPVRLTRDPGPDRNASWLADGSGILYSSQVSGRRDHDVCLAELPPQGGSQRRLVCDLSALGGDSVNAFEYPAGGPGGRLAVVMTSNPTSLGLPLAEGVVVAPGLDPANGAVVVRFPYSVPGEPAHTTVDHLRWLGPTRLVFVGSLRAYRDICSLPCVRRDTIQSGLKVGVLDLSAPGSSPGLVPGTEFASGVSPGSSEGEIYYTLGGDSRVYRRVLASGDVSVAYDFGAAGIARDVHVVGGRLAAIVGGRVHFTLDPQFGPIQADSGGFLHVVDLSSGADATLDGPGPELLRHPSLDPTGGQVVAEVLPRSIVDIPIDPKNPGAGTRPDTISGKDGDLYLFAAP